MSKHSQQSRAICRGAFTLPELLVVIGIIAILATMITVAAVKLYHVVDSFRPHH
jgi:prepilin-type N-terminal cleavage/methylation domain-containing protein